MAVIAPSPRLFARLQSPTLGHRSCQLFSTIVGKTHHLPQQLRQTALLITSLRLSPLRARTTSKKTSSTPSPLFMIASRLQTSGLRATRSAMASAYSMYHGATDQSKLTVTALGRWSSLSKELPSIDKIKSLHVYDFDNTLFKTPLPNPIVWNGMTLGMISSQDVFINGGWWHDSNILGATGQGLEKERQRAWEGWWNETIVELVRISMKQPDSLAVLLTGRGEAGFARLVNDMVSRKGLKFDMTVYKPPVGPENQRFDNTMHFKQIFLTSLMETYKDASEIKVYEDRPKHTEGFREFFEQYNGLQSRKPTRGTIDAEVIQVAEMSTTLDPVVEVAEVQRMVTLHNQEIAKQPLHLRPSSLKISHVAFFTSYMISSEDSKKLLALADIPTDIPGTSLKTHANSIMICPRPCPRDILKKVGGIGNKMKWEVTGTACYENSIWAACVNPVPANAKYHSENPVPLVLLAMKKGAKGVDVGRINMWSALPKEKRFTFESIVGEKALLKIEKEDPREHDYENLYPQQPAKRKYGQVDDLAGQQAKPIPTGPARGNSYGRGRGGGSFRGGARGRGRGGRGRGNYYKSLDDVDSRGNQGGYAGPESGQQGSGQSSNPTDLQNYY